MAPTKVVTGKVRLSYPHIFQPYAFDDDQPKKYSCMLLIPKQDKTTYEKLKAAEAEAAEQGKSKWGGKLPKNMAASVIRDGDEYAEEYPERAGHWFMTVSAKNKPGIVDQDVRPILDESEVYAGCYVRASVNAFSYATGPNKGVSFGLNNLQKIADGEPFGGFSRAEDDFDFVLDDDLI